MMPVTRTILNSLVTTVQSLSPVCFKNSFKIKSGPVDLLFFNLLIFFFTSDSEKSSFKKLLGTKILRP